MEPQVAYAAVAALCVTDRAVVQLRPQLKPEVTDFGLQPYRSTTTAVLMVSTPVILVHIRKAELT